MKDFYTDDKIEVGIDESSIGALIGDLFTSAVILPKKCPENKDIKLWNMINDSKKLNKKKRELLEEFIKEVAIDYSIVTIDNNRIDEINILEARKESYHKAIKQLKKKPEFILIDGTAFNDYYDEKGEKIEHECIKKGDTKFKSIAAASILAKTAKDKWILEISKKYPEYCLDKNSGYPTKYHKNAIEKYGITPLHRKTYGICKMWEKLPKTYID